MTIFYYLGLYGAWSNTKVILLSEEVITATLEVISTIKVILVANKLVSASLKVI